MQITVHRPNQIGGCITEITSANGTRIVIDVGANLPGSVSGEDVKVAEITEGCAGVFVSHYHGDHIGEYKQVHPPEKIYIGEVAKGIFLAVQTTLSKSEHTGVQIEDLERIRKFNTFKHHEPITLGDLTITPIRTDHSAFDSYMFLIGDGEKSLLHTGDFRTHGWTGEGMEESLKAYAGKVNGLICEGTMFSRLSGKIYTEQDLYEDAKKILHDNKHVFVLCSSTNIDTIASFYRAAQDMGRLAVGDGFQRSILEVVIARYRDSIYDLKKTAVLLPDKPQCAEKRGKCLRMMRNMGFCMFTRATPFFEDTLALFPDNTIIYSMWEGYLEDGKPYTDEVKKRFLDQAQANGSKIVNKHTSGHADEDAIIRLCEIVRPEIIFPIHSEKPDRFEELDSDSIKGKVRRLNDSESVAIR